MNGVRRLTKEKVSDLDPFLVKYQPSELKIASEFFETWLPFLSRDLCHGCALKLSNRVSSLNPASDAQVGSMKPEAIVTPSTPTITESRKINIKTKYKYGTDVAAATHSLGCKTEPNKLSDVIEEASHHSPSIETPSFPSSWADMALETEFEEEDGEPESKKPLGHTGSKVGQKPLLSREQREQIRFTNVGRKKDFCHYEKIKGKSVNILKGLELHAGIFSAAEQKRIVDFVYALRERGQKGELRERTYTAPAKWMRGKGRVTMQFGCCYNYAVDRKGNPPGILKNELVDPLPDLFKVIIRRLIKWHVLPPTCVPDSCIVNIYEEGDCIPPHIDNHDFLRPFCTVSFLSECDILFGSSLKVEGPGEFSGSVAIPLPVGSVLVLNGNGADVAKHCVPAVPTKRISITFRRMDVSKRPEGYVPESDLLGVKPLFYVEDRTKGILPTPDHSERRNPHLVEKGEFKASDMITRGGGHYQHNSTSAQRSEKKTLRVANWRINDF